MQKFLSAELANTQKYLLIKGGIDCELYEHYSNTHLTHIIRRAMSKITSTVVIKHFELK